MTKKSIQSVCEDEMTDKYHQERADERRRVLVPLLTMLAHGRKFKHKNMIPVMGAEDLITHINELLKPAELTLIDNISHVAKPVNEPLTVDHLSFTIRGKPVEMDRSSTKNKAGEPT